MKPTPNTSTCASSFAPGDRIELVYTDDPYTELRPGDQGTISSIQEHRYGPRPELELHVAWDGGSTLSMLPAQGDQFRAIPANRTQTTPTACRG